MTEIGDNSAAVNKDQLAGLIDRIENLEESKSNIGADIKEIYAEGKKAGFDTKAMREVVKLRRMDSAKLREHESLRDLYMAALGMLADTPLGRAALG